MVPDKGGTEEGLAVRLLAGHRADCFAKHSRRTFVLYDGWINNLTKTGKKGGSTFWHRFRCQDPKCPAIAIVRWDSMADLIDKALRDA